MVPDADLQLQCSVKALIDTVAPAIDPADKMAAEQLSLVIATLRMVRERLPVQRRFTRRLLEDGIALAEAVQASEPDAGLTETIAEAKAALSDADIEAGEIEAVRARLSHRVVQAIECAGADGLVRFGVAVAGRSRLPLARLRAWSSLSGFEPDPAALAPLDSLL